MGYSSDPASVRVDFFRPSGKWYTTEAVYWVGWKKENPIHEAFAKSLQEHLGSRLDGMTAVCLHPYHELAHPIMLQCGEWNNYKFEK